MAQGAYVLAFDTANEVVAVGIGRVGALGETGRAAVKRPCLQSDIVAVREVAAHRASNTVLLREVDAALAESSVSKDEIAAVCGRAGAYRRAHLQRWRRRRRRSKCRFCIDT
ncbi:MAG: hypothetical protein ACLTQI_04795 [Slackia sp.]